MNGSSIMMMFDYLENINDREIGVHSVSSIEG